MIRPHPRRFPRLFRRFVRRRPPHLRLGARGERIAARELRRSGYRIVARNYRPGRRRRDAELDIVAWEGRTLAVVEVKTRRGGFGDPAERVDAEKRERIRRSAARMWRLESGRRRIPPGSKLRLDVVEVWFARSGPLRAVSLLRRLRARFVRLVVRPGGRPIVRIRRGAF